MKALLNFAVLALVLCFLCCAGIQLPVLMQAYQGEHPHITPVLARIDNVPQAFYGSDQAFHVAYELILSNFSAEQVVVKAIHIKNAENKRQVKAISGEELDACIVPFGAKSTANKLDPGQSAIAYIHLEFSSKTEIPNLISHQLDLNNMALQTVALSRISHREPTKIGPPLRGESYVAGDSCCDSALHRRAALPINGSLKFAQRFAIDYELLDSSNRIFNGPKIKLSNFNIYGKEAIAVADGLVVACTDGLVEAEAGALPQGINLENAVGNSVVLEISPHVYALYAHLQPGSLMVKEGEQVRQGQVIGLVGNSGNSLAPHLHFQLMDSPSPLNSNGLPYLIDDFTLTAKGLSTKDFNDAESSGKPLLLSPHTPPKRLIGSFPMDLSVVSFH